VVREGRISSFRLNIPWSTLGSEAVHIMIEDVTLLAAPLDKAAWDEDEVRRQYCCVFAIFLCYEWASFGIFIRLGKPPSASEQGAEG
jgi:hypothetical protein